MADLTDDIGAVYDLVAAVCTERLRHGVSPFSAHEAAALQDHILEDATRVPLLVHVATLLIVGFAKGAAVAEGRDPAQHLEEILAFCRPGITGEAHSD